MASKEHKIVRRAQAMSQLGFLSTLLAERFNIEPVNTQVVNRDPELAEIERIERVNDLLRLLAETSDTKDADTESLKKPAAKKHGASR